LQWLEDGLGGESVPEGVPPGPLFSRFGLLAGALERVVAGLPRFFERRFGDPAPAPGARRAGGCFSAPPLPRARSSFCAASAAHHQLRPAKRAKRPRLPT